MLAVSTTAGTACAVTGTASAIRTADALDPLFLSLMDIEKRKAQDHHNDPED